MRSVCRYVSDRDPRVEKLFGTVSPFCGITKSISLITRSELEPRIIVAGGDLSNIEVWRSNYKRLIASYHIGGSGVNLEETLTKALAEAVERYASILVSITGGRNRLKFGTQSEFGPSERFLDVENFRWFSSRFSSIDDFPFGNPTPEDELTWIEVKSVNTGEREFVPAHAVLVGFEGGVGEKRYIPSVTSGTSVHVTRDLSFRNSLFELVQVDAVMGHWYGRDCDVFKFEVDNSLPNLRRIIEQHWSNEMPEPSFYVLAPNEVPLHVVICAVSADVGPPFLGLGQGSDLDLERAAYKALLEGIGVFNLAKIAALEFDDTEAEKENKFRDLDSNVVHYSNEENAKIVFDKLGWEHISASELISNKKIKSIDQIICILIEQGIRLYEIDLYCKETQYFDLFATRLWSPDLLCLCLPGLPFDAHPRFDTFGGFANASPHPYP